MINSCVQSKIIEISQIQIGKLSENNNFNTICDPNELCNILNEIRLEYNTLINYPLLNHILKLQLLCFL